ncbi:MAG: nascent polypeptide-associated complex protein, partial [Nitrososphaerota archaeon]
MKKIPPRVLRRMQARMLGNLGLDLKEVQGVEEVVIKMQDKDIKIKSPAVLMMKLEGEVIYQIVGGEVSEEQRIVEEVVEEGYTPSDEDVFLVSSQAGVSEDEARRALIEAGGDLAKAIL